MLDAANTAASTVVAEAKTQGVTVEPAQPDADRLTQMAGAAAGVIAGGYATAAAREALGAAAENVADAVTAALTAMSTATRGWVADNLGPLMHAAAHEGRLAVYAAHPPKTLVADEHNDRNRCEPCAEVNGKRYDTLDEALADYPGFGGFRGCLGRNRCRGQITAVWS